MARYLCLAQVHARGRARRRKRGDPTGAATVTPMECTILERVAVKLPAHTPVWSLLRRHATRQSITDAQFPDDAFEAHVVVPAQLGSEAVAAIGATLSERRALMAAAEKNAPDADVLGRHYDKLSAQEMEWLALRNLLAAALRQSGTKRTGKRARSPSRVLVLIDV